MLYARVVRNVSAEEECVKLLQNGLNDRFLNDIVFYFDYNFF